MPGPGYGSAQASLKGGETKMSQRIQITVPDEMFEELKKLKGRFCVSKVCQEAIKLRIQEETTGIDLVQYYRAKMEQRSHRSQMFM